MNKDILQEKKAQLEEQIKQLQAQHNQLLGAIAMVDNLINEIKEEPKEDEDANTGSDK